MKEAHSYISEVSSSTHAADTCHQTHRPKHGWWLHADKFCEKPTFLRGFFGSIKLTHHLSASLPKCIELGPLDKRGYNKVECKFMIIGDWQLVNRSICWMSSQRLSGGHRSVWTEETISTQWLISNDITKWLLRNIIQGRRQYRSDSFHCIFSWRKFIFINQRAKIWRVRPPNQRCEQWKATMLMWKR